MALCDVDSAATPANTFKHYPRAKQYKDFRVMLDQQKDIDAVIVATPDHSPCRDRHGGHPARQARLRSEADGPLASTKPGC